MLHVSRRISLSKDVFLKIFLTASTSTPGSLPNPYLSLLTKAILLGITTRPVSNRLSAWTSVPFGTFPCLTARFLMANMASPTSPPWGHLSRHVKHERQCHGNVPSKTSERSPRMIISISFLGLCSCTTLATGQLLVHLPHCIHVRTPRPRGVFATSSMK